MAHDNADIYRIALQRLQGFRKTSGMTQKQVADILSVERSTYAYYESGKSIPSIDVVDKLLKIFRVDYNVIFGDWDEEKDSRVIKLRDNRDIMFMVDLTPEEKELVSRFRLMKSSQQKDLLSQLGVVFDAVEETDSATKDD